MNTATSFFTDNRLRQATSQLAAYRKRGAKPPPESVAQSLARAKARAVADGNAAFAKACWCLERIYDVQRLYLDAFQSMKAGKFGAAWGALERCEIAWLELDRHFSEADDEFGIEFVRKHVRQLQELFPYTYFISPEWLYEEVHCGTCDAVVSPFDSCGHEKGEIYDGEMCYHKVTKVKAIAMAIVTNPVQKYSVLGTPEGPQWDYSNVAYVMAGVTSPWDGWRMEFTKRRHPHSNFPGTKPDDPCPCEEGKKYQDCCLHQEGVLRPHLQIWFDVEPPATLPPIVYPKAVPKPS